MGWSFKRISSFDFDSTVIVQHYILRKIILIASRSNERDFPIRKIIDKRMMKTQSTNAGTSWKKQTTHFEIAKYFRRAQMRSEGYFLYLAKMHSRWSHDSTALAWSWATVITSLNLTDFFTWTTQPWMNTFVSSPQRPSWLKFLHVRGVKFRYVSYLAQ